MIKGTTTTGFEYEIKEAALDDWKFLKHLRKIDKGEVQYIIDAAEFLLGEDQLDKLEKHVCDETGRISTEKMMDEISEIMNTNQDVKNS